MIYLELFLMFFIIGLFTFGGGYAMIPLIEHEVITRGYLTEIDFCNILSISESTPGPIAVNIATFVGFSQAGVLGSILSTLGVILPSFIIILLIASILTKFIDKPAIKAVLHGFQGIVIGLILGTGAYHLFTDIFREVNETYSFDYKSLIIVVVIIIASILFKVFKKKSLSPYLILIIGGLLGAALYFI